MGDTQNRTVEAVIGTQDQGAIITTLNHNFQVLTERIKELNLSISYLDVLKVGQIYSITDPTATDDNLKLFVSSCWNILANYAGVYIQCLEDTTSTLFTWMGDEVKHGDFIVKLPNNQSLHLASATPTYMVPTRYSAGSSQLIFELQSSTSTVTVDNVTFPEYATSGLQATTTACSSGSTFPSDAGVRDRRYYATATGEEVFFDASTMPTVAPINLTIHDIRN